MNHLQQGDVEFLVRVSDPHGVYVADHGPDRDRIGRLKSGGFLVSRGWSPGSGLKLSTTRAGDTVLALLDQLKGGAS